MLKMFALKRGLKIFEWPSKFNQTKHFVILSKM